MTAISPYGVIPPTNLFSILANGSPAAFSVNEEGRIEFWNRGAEEIIGTMADEALGRRCHEIVAGRDVFGNLFCCEDCSILATAKRTEELHAFEIEVPATQGHPANRLAVTVLKVPGEQRNQFRLVHILEPVDAAKRLARDLERVGGRSRPGGRRRPAENPTDRTADGPPLTRREREILAYVAEGFQNKEIAQALDISLATARNHVRNILEKLGAHSKLEAAAQAYRNGWVEPNQGPGPIDRSLGGRGKSRK